MVLKYPMSQLAPMTLMVTVFALLSGYLIYGEQLSAAQWVSCSAFLSGIILVLYPRPSSRPDKAVRLRPST